MKIRKTMIFYIIAFAITLVSLSCNRDSVAGATDTPNSLYGSIYRPDSGGPASGARVYILPGSYSEALRTGHALTDGAINVVDSTVTDAQGNFSFKVNQGLYTVHAVVDSFFTTYIENVVLSDFDVALQAETLSIGASLKGIVVNTTGAPMKAVLAGTPFVSNVNLDGAFSFSTVPQGTYTLIVMISQRTGERGAFFNSLVSLEKNSVHIVDTIRVPFLSKDNLFRLDDFEDNNLTNLYNGSWWNSINTPSIGNYSIVYPGVNNSKYCLSFKYLWSGADVLFGTNLGQHLRPWNIKEIKDISNVKSMSIWVRGTGHTVSVLFHSPVIEDWNDFVCELPHSTQTWTHYTINIPADLKHQFSEKPLASNSITWSQVAPAMQSIVFAPGNPVAGDSGSLFIDNIEFTTQ